MENKLSKYPRILNRYNQKNIKYAKFVLKLAYKNFKTQYNYIKIQHSQRPVKFPLAFHLVELNRKNHSKKKLAINTVHKLGCIC